MQRSSATGNVPDSVSKKRDGWAVILLILCAWSLHGHGLSLGFWLDDHNHLELCAQNGFEDLASGNRFNWNERIAHAWWAKKETGWAYFRPVTVAVRTTMWRLFGLNAVPYHLLHLTLYSVSVVIFFGLLRRCGWNTITSFIAVLFFLMHPANAFTTPWLANDGPILVGLWLVSALWLFHSSAQAGHRRLDLLAGVILCYALAMLSRENGIVVGPILLVFDWLCSPRSTETSAADVTWRRRSTIYSVLALEGVGYLFLRSWALGEVPLPRSPYVHWPNEPGFGEWLPYKILNDLVCLPLGLPLVPIVEVSWWQEHARCATLAVFAVAALVAIVIVPVWRSRVTWGLLAGIALAQAPTLLVFSAPYNYYLATAGWALLLTAGARYFWASRPRLVCCVMSGLASWYLLALWGETWAMHSMARAERLVRADVLATDPSQYPRGTRIFFINLPFSAVEVGPSLRLATGRPDLEIYPITFAPELFWPKDYVHVSQEDDHTLLLRSTGRAAFSGKFGDQVQLAWFGARHSDLHTGPVTIAPQAGPMPFRVEVVELETEGIRAVRIIFDRPVADPTNRIFLSSPSAMAHEFNFLSGMPPVSTIPPSERIASVRFPLYKACGITVSSDTQDFDRVRRMQRTMELGERVLGCD